MYSRRPYNLGPGRRFSPSVVSSQSRMSSDCAKTRQAMTPERSERSCGSRTVLNSSDAPLNHLIWNDALHRCAMKRCSFGSRFQKSIQTLCLLRGASMSTLSLRGYYFYASRCGVAPLRL